MLETEMRPVLVIGAWSLGFVCDLVLVIWNFFGYPATISG
jgi:hypothetical protein